jgi:hypothetical protein
MTAFLVLLLLCVILVIGRSDKIGTLMALSTMPILLYSAATAVGAVLIAQKIAALIGLLYALVAQFFVAKS